MAWNNFFNFLAGGTRVEEANATATSYWRVQRLFENSPYTQDKQKDFVVDLVARACVRADLVSIRPLLKALSQLVDDLIITMGSYSGFPVARKGRRSRPFTGPLYPRCYYLGWLVGET